MSVVEWLSPQRWPPPNGLSHQVFASVILGVSGSLREILFFFQYNNAGPERSRVPLRKSDEAHGNFVAKILFPIRDPGSRKSHDFRYEYHRSCLSERLRVPLRGKKKGRNLL